MDEDVQPTSTLVEPREFRSYCFRGEGRANFVVSAKCEKSGVRIVWRLAKHRKSGTVTIKPKCHVVIAYLEKLIVPILGRQYLIKPRIVHIDVNSLHHLSKIPSLPLNMKVETFSELLNEEKFPSSTSFFSRRNLPESVDYVSALEMVDATWMPKMRQPSQYCGPTITVEIKPKQGFFQNHPGILVPYCNNCILQLEKCYSDAFEQMYDFCPLDLFSGNLQRMRHALNALIAVPHRNLRIFINGTVIHSDEVRLSTEQLTQTFIGYGISLDQLVTALEKCYSDAFEQMYDFCPLDLFSGNLQRMRHALNALIAVPHRNLRIFINGTVIHSDEVRLSTEQLTQTFIGYGISLDQLVTALCCVLSGAHSDRSFEMHRSSVLRKLINAQRIDSVGIVRAYQIYNSLPPHVQKELLNKCLLPRKGLSFLQKSTDRALIERYLLAATVKDCSLMVSLRPVDRCLFPPSRFGAASSSENFVEVSSTVLPIGADTATAHSQACFAFSINIVDLDPKSPKNLLNAYERFMNGVKLIENAPPGLRRPCVL
uniref:Inositol-pentakisphosphate 2-kinase n=1 Tax=Ascaris lumbricoides TaxID=6252 RepID=A0A9J2PU56_ASCLU